MTETALMQHTKGPWIFKPKDFNCACDGICNESVGSVFSPSDNRYVAKIEVDAGDTPLVEIANAHLIAAAPDLLAACKLALNAFEKNWAIDWNDLRRAIDKAEGTSAT